MNNSSHPSVCVHPKTALVSMLVGVLMSVVVGAGCPDNPSGEQRCNDFRDCAQGAECSDGLCVALDVQPEPGSPDVVDSGDLERDAGDGSQDAGPDGGPRDSGTTEPDDGGTGVAEPDDGGVPDDGGDVVAPIVFADDLVEVKITSDAFNVDERLLWSVTRIEDGTSCAVSVVSMSGASSETTIVTEVGDHTSQPTTDGDLEIECVGPNGEVVSGALSFQVWNATISVTPTPSSTNVTYTSTHSTSCALSILDDVVATGAGSGETSIDAAGGTLTLVCDGANGALLTVRKDFAFETPSTRGIEVSPLDDGVQMHWDVATHATCTLTHGGVDVEVQFVAPGPFLYFVEDASSAEGEWELKCANDAGISDSDTLVVDSLPKISSITFASNGFVSTMSWQLGGACTLDGVDIESAGQVTLTFMQQEYFFECRSNSGVVTTSRRISFGPTTLPSEFDPHISLGNVTMQAIDVAEPPSLVFVRGDLLANAAATGELNLPDLVEVSGDLRFPPMAGFSTISLAKLKIIQNQLRIVDNDSIQRISLPSLQRVNQILLRRLPQLNALDLSGLTETSGQVRLDSLDVLTGANLSKLSTAGNVVVERCPLLLNVVFNDLIIVEGIFEIRENESVVEILLESLTQAGTVSIEGNAQVEEIYAPNLAVVESLEITNNNLLTFIEIDALENVEEIRIVNNNTLDNAVAAAVGAQSATAETCPNATPCN